jgi:hypothetical protein
MPERVFQICGATVPPLIGRKAALQRLISALTKATPDHLQIVGARFAGKTVLLHALAEIMRRPGSPYSAVVVWDLGHQTPNSDEEFLLTLRDRTAEALEPVKKDYAAHLRSVKEKPYGELCEVFDALRSENSKVLMLWDGLDKPLGSGKLTRNLWDQLRELASRPSLRLVTTSRKQLHELVRSTESQTSDFWGIFDPSPIKLGYFDDEDIDEAISRVPRIAFGLGAKAELINWTGAFPPLLLELLNAINTDAVGGAVEGKAVNRIAEGVAEGPDALLAALWSDCSQSSKDLFHALVESGPIDQSKCGHADLSALVEKGFARKSGSKCQSSCRFLEKFIAKHISDMGSMVRLFGSEEAFRGNVRPVLEKRLSHMRKLDANLRRYLDRGIEDLPDHPEDCLRNVRGIIDKLLDLIWEAELGADKRIPPEYFELWLSRDERGAELSWNGNFPLRRGDQVRLLQLLTGTERSPRKAKAISKSTYALVQAAHGLGNLGQHLEGVTIHVGVAFAAISVCLELAASLERELKGI